MYIVGFNGPPRVGKDTIASRLVKELDTWGDGLPTKLSPLSMPMRLRAFAALGIRYSAETYEFIKDVKQDVLGGKTLREFMILDSENFMKPTFGNEIWSRLHAAPIPRIPGVTIVPDFGFPHEPTYLQDMFGVSNVLTVQVHRGDDDWKNDSRGWVSGLHLFTAMNHGGLDTVDSIVHSLTTFMMDTLNWKL